MISKRLHPASFSNVNAQLAQKAPLANPTFTGLVTTEGQIKFPATQSTSSDPNTLDDYEEGTFTPTVVGATTAGVGTYTTQSGIYSKIGKLVFFDILLTWTAHTGTGTMNINGLPFTSEESTPATPFAFDIAIGSTTFASVKKLNTQIGLYSATTAGVLIELTIDTNGTYRVSGCYTTNT